MAFFGKFQQAIGVVAPWFLRQQNLGAFLEAVGLCLDGAADNQLQGMRLGYPLRCPANQLPTILHDRGLPSYPTEPEAGTRARATDWWRLHKQRGSHQGEMRHLAPYFLPSYPQIAIAHQNGDGSIATWHRLTAGSPASGGSVYSATQANPSNFNWDGKTSEWSRFVVFVDMSTTGYTAPHTYDSGGIYDTSGWTYDGLTAQQALDIPQMILDWKAADSWCLAVVAVWPMVGGAPFPTAAGVPTQDATGWWSLPNGKWGSPIDPGNGKITRPPNFTFLLDNPSP